MSTRKLNESEKKKVIAFIERGKFFHIEPDEFASNINRNADLFIQLYDLREEIRQEVDKKAPQSNRELLEEIFAKVFELVISYYDVFEMFMSYTDYYPEYLDIFGKAVEQGLQEKGIREWSASDYLDIKVTDEVYRACLYTTLCNFLEKTKRAGREKLLTYAEFVKKYSTQDFSKTTDAWANQQRENSFTTATNKLNKHIRRLRENRSRYKPRGRWKAIPSVAESNLLLVYGTILDTQNFYKGADNIDYRQYGRLYNKLHCALKSKKDEGYQERVDTACDKALSLIKKLKYEDYLKMNEFFFSKICDEHSEFLGINLLYLEMGHSLYAVTKAVNNLSEVEDENEIEDILVRTVILRDIYFPKLYDVFYHIEDKERLVECVRAFKILIVFTVEASRPILDEFIEAGYFGSVEEWYALFLDVSNELAKEEFPELNVKIPKDPKNPTRDLLQSCFEAVLSAPILTYYNDDEPKNEDN